MLCEKTSNISLVLLLFNRLVARGERKSTNDNSLSTLVDTKRISKPSLMSLRQVLLKLSIVLWFHQDGIVSSSFALGYFNYPTRWPSSSVEATSTYLMLLHSSMLPSSTENPKRWVERFSSRSFSAAAATRQDEMFESTTTTNTSSVSHSHLVGKTHRVNVKTLDVLSLSSIRSTLIRQEETIIFGLIERAQFRSNDIVYEPNGFGNLGIPDGVVITDDTRRLELERLSFLEYMLLSTEVLHNKVRRYTSPEEHPFFPNYLPCGPMANLAPLDYPKDLLSSTGSASELNFNSILLQRYIKEIIPSITIPGDDEQHGSSVVNDVTLLQALSRRIHYGKFVAESKYRDSPEKYQALVDADDDDGVMALLTNIDVEKKLLRRVRLKAANYGREPMDLFVTTEEQQSDDDSGSTSDDAERRMVAVAAATAVMVALESWDRTRQRAHSSDESSKVDPRVIEAIYRDILIPLTKDIEVAYLFRRCGKEPPMKYLG